MFMKALKGSVLRKNMFQAKMEAEVGYLSPEQTEGEAYVDALSDLYSLGAVVYALLTGRPPFQGDSPRETLKQIREAELVKPSKHMRGIPAEFEWVVMTMLSRERKYRY